MGNKTFYGDDHSSSSETQGQIVGRGKVGTCEKNVGEEKSSPFALDVSPIRPHFFRPFRLLLAPLSARGLRG